LHQVSKTLAPVLPEIVLSEAPTTGHAWRVIASGEPMCRLEDDAFVAPSTAATGAPGQHTFVFRTIGPGTGAIELHYLSGLTASPPSQRFRVSVLVE
jgi:predicted secreted protein